MIGVLKLSCKLKLLTKEQFMICYSSKHGNSNLCFDQRIPYDNNVLPMHLLRVSLPQPPGCHLFRQLQIPSARINTCLASLQIFRLYDNRAN